jgi:membrane fusion protein, copper/silver efflux system
MNITKTQLLTGAGLIITGLLLGWLIFGGSHEPDPHAGHDHEITSENGEEVWTCSMHPSVREDGPGQCPICGMDLIPATSEAQEDDYSMVMTEASMQLANIQTTPVIRDIPKKEIRLPGRVAVDERRISYVTTHFEGRVQNVQIDYTGAPISEGEVMATIYSPELVSAQRELLEAVRVRDRNPGLYESAVRKFRLWEFTDEQIQNIVDRGEVMRNMEILSPVDGFVMKRNVVDEQHVMEGTVIYEVANLDYLWITLEAYEEDLNWLSEGSDIEFTTRSNSGRTYQAVVDYIDPTFNPQKRTIRVRADVDNADHSLRPDMLVSGKLTSEMRETKLLVPASSVLWTGPRSLVYIKDISADVPRFEVREVELGVRAGDYYVIEEGIAEGEEVVFHGNFRLDSEMQLADRFSMMNRQPGTGAVPVHDHGDVTDRPARETETHDGHSHEQFEDVPAEFRIQLTETIEAYIRGKDAFVNSDLQTAASEFETFISKLQEIGEHGLSGSGHEAWMESYGSLTNFATEIIESDDIEQARSAFRALSDDLIMAVQMFGIEDVVYHQYCPMAFDDEGAYWLSDQEQIQNPYLPETMPGCGEVIERIES